MTDHMSVDERAAYFQDPGYGRVSDLCHSLGYGDASTSNRSYNSLSQRSIDFRKNWIKRTEGISHLNFPLQCDAPEVVKCAEEFLVAHEQLFTAPEDEPRDPAWLCLPDDKSKILDTITKLMCTQESMYRRNDEYLKRKRKQTAVVEEGSDSELEGVMEEKAPDDDFTIRVASDPAQPEEIDNAHESDGTGTKRSIERHLEYTYPVDAVYETVAPDWLYDPLQPWPNNEQAFAFRYFHERNLYHANKHNRYHVKRFAQALTKRLDVEVDSAKEVIIRQRCKELIKDISMLWGEKGCGFLVRTSTGLVKTAQFENAWKFHRSQWIYKVHGGMTDGIPELNQVPAPGINEEEPSRKRLHEIQPPPPVLSAVTNTEHSSKRPRYSIGRSQEQASPQPPVTSERQEEVVTVQPPPPQQVPVPQNQGHVIHQTAPQQFTTMPFQQKPAPIAPAGAGFTPVNVLRSNALPIGAQPADWDRRSSRGTSGRPVEQDAPRPMTEVSQSQPQPHQSHPPSHSLPTSSNNVPKPTFDLFNLDPTRQTRSTSSVTAGTAERPGPVPVAAPAQVPIQTQAPPPQEYRAPESALTPTSLSNAEIRQPTPAENKQFGPIDAKIPFRSGSTATPEPSSAPKPKRLTFILENANRSPDHDNPLPADIFRSSSISQFFDLFCQRSGRSRETTNYLTFKYNWGGRDSFVVKEQGNEVDWEEIKERVKDTFLMARDRVSNRKQLRFQVWVMGPEDEDEEW